MKARPLNYHMFCLITLFETDQLLFLYFQTDDGFLTSKTITVAANEAITEDNWPTLVSITFDTHCLVSGAKFDNSDMIKKFTISYTLNGKNVVYKDNYSEEETTVSFFKEPLQLLEAVCKS